MLEAEKNYGEKPQQTGNDMLPGKPQQTGNDMLPGKPQQSGNNMLPGRKLQQSGSVRALYRYPQRKTPAVQEEALTLTKGSGIEGDCHADGGERQISLLTVAEKEWMEQQEIPGFCFRKYKQNVLLDGISLEACRPGDILICGEAQMELTASIKSCHRELCRLAMEGGNCLLAGSVRFARVKKSGIMQKEMQIWCMADQEEDGYPMPSDDRS